MPWPASVSAASAISVRSDSGLRSTGDDELHRQVVVVADLAELADDLLPVDRPLAAGHAVVVGDVEVDEQVAGVPDRLRPVGLLDVHVEDVERDAAVAADVLGHRDGLVGAVDEVGLEAVERLDADPHADLLRVRLALLEPSTAHRHSSSGDAIGTPLPTVEGTTVRIFPPIEATSESQSLTYWTLAMPHVVVLVHEVAAAGHERHRAPALEAVAVEQALTCSAS